LQRIALAAHEQGVPAARRAVGQRFFVPAPFHPRDYFDTASAPAGQLLTHLGDSAITGER